MFGQRTKARTLGHIAREMSVAMRPKVAPVNKSKVPVATRFPRRNVTSMQGNPYERPPTKEELASGQILLLQTGVEQRSTRKLCHRKLPRTGQIKGVLVVVHDALYRHTTFAGTGTLPLVPFF